jgi:hypothetical protein
MGGGKKEDLIQIVFSMRVSKRRGFVDLAFFKAL